MNFKRRIPNVENLQIEKDIIDFLDLNVPDFGKRIAEIIMLDLKEKAEEDKSIDELIKFLQTNINDYLINPEKRKIFEEKYLPLLKKVAFVSNPTDIKSVLEREGKLYSEAQNKIKDLELPEEEKYKIEIFKKFLRTHYKNSKMFFDFFEEYKHFAAGQDLTELIALLISGKKENKTKVIMKMLDKMIETKNLKPQDFIENLRIFVSRRAKKDNSLIAAYLLDRISELMPFDPTRINKRNSVEVQTENNMFLIGAIDKLNSVSYFNQKDKKD